MAETDSNGREGRGARDELSLPLSKTPDDIGVRGADDGTRNKVVDETGPLNRHTKAPRVVGAKMSAAFREKITSQLNPALREKILRHLQDTRIQESLALIDLFNSRSVRFVVLKGVTLQCFNKDRTFYDLDIFVPRTDFEKAMVLLEIAGYSPKRTDSEKYRRNTGFHIEYNKPDHIQVELHYRLFQCSTLDENELPLMEERCFLAISKTRVPCLSGELQLLEVFLHYFYNHGFLMFSTKWFEDIETVIRYQDIDWTRFLVLAKKTGCCELLCRILYFLEEFNGKPSAMPPQVRSELRKNSSGTRLFLTAPFDRNFLHEYRKLERIAIPEEKARRRSRLDWKIKYSLLLSLGLRPDFFRLLWFYNVSTGDTA